MHEFNLAIIPERLSEEKPRNTIAFPKLISHGEARHRLLLEVIQFQLKN